MKLQFLGAEESLGWIARVPDYLETVEALPAATLTDSGAMIE
jgi:hypothetical protein